MDEPLTDVSFEEHDGRSECIPRNWVTQATWGTPGGMQYQHLEFPWNPRYRVVLARDRATGEPVGMHTWLEYPWGFLRHLLIVTPTHRRRGVAHRLMAEGRARFGARLRDGQVIAGIVDRTHAISRRLSSHAGYEAHRQFDVLNYSRRSPRRNPLARLATADEIREVLQPHIACLDRQWDDFSTMATPENTWVLTSPSGEIVASATVIHHRMAIESIGMPWPLDALARRALPAFTNGAHSGNYPFVSIHYPWGQVGSFSSLWESIMACTGVSALSVSFDTTDPMYAAVRNVVDFGYLGTFVGPMPWLVTSSEAPLSPRPLAWPAENW